RHSLAFLGKEPPATLTTPPITKPAPITVANAPTRNPPAVRTSSAPTQLVRTVPVRRVLPPPDPECGVIIVIVHDLRGISRCVQVRGEAWHGRCPADLSRWELTAPHVARACMSGSKQMVILALSGPAAQLPTNDRSAEDLAACILGIPRGCDTEGACYN